MKVSSAQPDDFKIGDILMCLQEVWLWNDEFLHASNEKLTPGDLILFLGQSEKRIYKILPFGRDTVFWIVFSVGRFQKA